MYNFDELVDRRNTNSVKYDYAREMGKPANAIPLWIADMDFKVPEEVEEALMKCAEHAVYGYTDTKDDYNHAVMGWFLSNFGFRSEPDWIIKTPSILYAMAMAIRAFTDEGDSVLLQKPIYHSFEPIITRNDRKLINNPLIYENGKYYIDFDDFERKIRDENVKIFILCSPHNPVARVWTADELYKMGQICLKYGCIVISDEIHCDIVYNGLKHHMFTNVCRDFAQNAIICTAPSKTFNLAGLQCSNIFIPNEALRVKFTHEMDKLGHNRLNIMGLAACKSAYLHGGSWLAHLKKHLQSNIRLIQKFLADTTKVKMIEPEATYLMWLDFTAFNLPHQELDEMLLNAGLWLSSGISFGEEGAGFFRMNIACPTDTLKAALNNLKKVL
ncbi:MAG: pyridoxal phosphate-dependent aminotransferase [Turicibacter sp.]|nr:pyridoxal phosphate-dependent aminotransferase [Turicibacter sp.]